ncbi:hypothetical protein CDAR_519601 [Caerostris darwini]|uniref:Uncharacterized protein n=1 Tax=Caerostris darwini TaxID=1538125 RepID=A0AAV4TPA5_9ARAC|nr:hypothetical protein CDAR_519601 [Caerostris darwini]
MHSSYHPVKFPAPEGRAVETCTALALRLPRSVAEIFIANTQIPSSFYCGISSAAEGLPRWRRLASLFFSTPSFHPRLHPRIRDFRARAGTRSGFVPIRASNQDEGGSGRDGIISVEQSAFCVHGIPFESFGFASWCLEQKFHKLNIPTESYLINSVYEYIKPVGL